MWSLGVLLYVLVSGVMPFYDKDVHKLFDKIRNGKWEFKEKHFKHVSRECKDLIYKLIVRNPRNRLTATVALKHPWFEVVNNSIYKTPTIISQGQIVMTYH